MHNGRAQSTPATNYIRHYQNEIHSEHSQRIMKFLFICVALTLIMISSVIAGLGYLGLRRITDWNSNRKARMEWRRNTRENAIAQRRQYLEGNLSTEIRNTIPDAFYTYDGFRDWWRMPLVFPYQLKCINTHDRANVETYNPDYPVANPNKSSQHIFGGVVRLATDNTILVYERRNGATQVYGILIYATGELTEFNEKDKLWKAAGDAGYTQEYSLLTVKELFRYYYNWDQVFDDSHR